MINKISQIRFFDFLKTLIIFSAIQPYIGVPLLFKSDIQPICLFLCLIYLISFNKFYLSKNQILISILLFTPAIFSTFQLFLMENNSFLEIFRRLFPLFASPIYFITFTSVFADFRRVKFIKNALLFFVITFFIGFILNIFTKDLITGLFITRGTYEAYGFRGFNSFFPEQSRIPEQCFFAFYLYFFHRKYLNFKPIFLAIIALLAKSGQAIVMTFTLLPFIFISLLPSKLRSIRFFKKSNLLIPLISPFLIFLIFRFMSTSRGGIAILELFKIGFSYLASDMGVLIKMTGAMFVATRILNPDFTIISAAKPWEHLINNPQLSDTYQNICTFITSINNCPTTYSIYTGLGSYIVYYGIYGIFLVLLLFGLSLNAVAKKFLKKERLLFYSLLFAFFINSILKIPLANPSMIMIICLFLSPELDFEFYKKKPNIESL